MVLLKPSENMNFGNDISFKSRFIDILPWLDGEDLAHEIQ
jgi:hypothetical protein